MVAYPRLYISAQTHERIRKIAKKKGVDMKSLGDKIAKAGIKALGL